MMKKRCAVLTLLATLVLFVVLTGCNNAESSVVGSWTVKEYILDNETISKDKLTEYLGSNAGIIYNKMSITFTASGNCVVKKGNVITGDLIETNLAYTVQDGLIELYNPDDNTEFELITYENGYISVELSDELTAIFNKK